MLLVGVNALDGGELDEVSTVPILHTQRKISCKPPISTVVVAELARRHVMSYRGRSEGDAHGCPFDRTRIDFLALSRLFFFVPRKVTHRELCWAL